MADKKYYWLKLQKDFFKRHDIKIIKSMPNGKDYVIFYLTLLLESLNHDGELRFSDTIPYNEEMLSVITDTNIDIVRSAMKVLTDLKMVEILEDSTIFMTEINKMLGCETSVAERVRNHRENQKVLQCNNVKQKCNTEIEIEKEIDIELEKESTEDKPPKLKKSKFGEYHHILLTDEQYQKLVSDYSESLIKEYITKIDEWIQTKGKSPYKDFNLAIRNWLTKDNKKPQANKKSYSEVI